MSADPWTAPVPQPGDFDIELATIGSRHVERYEGDVSATVRILLSVEGDDAQRIERLAAARGQKPSDVVADLLRDADRPAA